MSVDKRIVKTASDAKRSVNMAVEDKKTEKADRRFANTTGYAKFTDKMKKTRGCIIAWKRSFQRLHLGNMFIFQSIFIPSWNLEGIQIKIYQSRLQTLPIVHFSSLI